ncbi:MAG: PAS domain S-box protein [Dehalococcoidia bacterium]
MNRMDKKTTRKRTEQITGTVRNDISGMSYDDIANALQDLEIHKVELELQNEELRHIQQSLQESRDRYMDLYDYAPVGYFTINSRSNTIVEVNLTACNLLGVEREKLLKTRFTRYVTPEFADKFYLCRKSCRDSQHSQSCDLKMYRGDCASFWAALELLNLPDSQQLRIAMLDNTGRKDVEQLPVKDGGGVNISM